MRQRNPKLAYRLSRVAILVNVAEVTRFTKLRRCADVKLLARRRLASSQFPAPHCDSGSGRGASHISQLCGISDKPQANNVVNRVTMTSGLPHDW